MIEMVIMWAIIVVIDVACVVYLYKYEHNKN